MSSESVLRPDILNEDLAVEEQAVVIQPLVEQYFDGLISTAVRPERTRSPQPSKNIIEFTELLGQGIIDYEARSNASKDRKLIVLYDQPDTPIDVEAVSILFAQRQPGSWSQGAPFEGKIKNRKPILRQVLDDPDNPGYKRAVLGFFYDNVIELTCWARTHKAANARALWLESFMEEYTWFFEYSGVNRILYQGWGQHRKIDVMNNRYFGVPINYFVRTEKLRDVSQKTLERICITLAAAAEI